MDAGTETALRPDLRVMAGMVTQGARVLDIGCGDGALLHFLKQSKNVDARGIELSQEGVNACVARGLSVVQGDADRDLADYPTGAFDFVILGQTIQATRRPKAVLEQIARIGRRSIISMPNFAHWRTRVALLTGGRMPVTRALPNAWYDTPNIHMCSVRDFEELARSSGLRIERIVSMRKGQASDAKPFSIHANLLAEEAIFLLSAPA